MREHRHYPEWIEDPHDDRWDDQPIMRENPRPDRRFWPGLGWGAVICGVIWVAAITALVIWL